MVDPAEMAPINATEVLFGMGYSIIMTSKSDISNVKDITATANGTYFTIKLKQMQYNNSNLTETEYSTRPCKEFVEELNTDGKNAKNNPYNTAYQQSKTLL